MDDFRNGVEKVFGYPGRLLDGSKRSYSERHPESVVYFNACVFDANGRQIWFGDIDLTIDAERLQAAANEQGSELHVTPEQPFRRYGLETCRKREPDVVKTFVPQEQI